MIFEKYWFYSQETLPTDSVHKFTNRLWTEKSETFARRGPYFEDMYIHK